MVKTVSFATALAVAFVLGNSSILAGEKPEKEKPDAAGKKELIAFVGVNNCKLCHSDAETGDQFGKWKKSKHAEAFKTLQGDKAKEIGKKQGIADPSKSEKCLKCHVTGAMLPADAPKALTAKVKPADGLGCESCHGPGAKYAKKEVFEKGKEAAMALGLIDPNEKVCVHCHNKESPTWTGSFNFEEMAKKIAHPNPKTEKAKKAAK